MAIKYGYMLIQPGKPAFFSEESWDNAEKAREAGQAAAPPDTHVVVTETHPAPVVISNN